MEEIKVAGDKLKSTLKTLIREGNVRRIIVRNATGRTLLDMPLTAGIAGVVLLPLWTAIASIVMLAKEFTVVIERHSDSTSVSTDSSDV